MWALALCDRTSIIHQLGSTENQRAEWIDFIGMLAFKQAVMTGVSLEGFMTGVSLKGTR